MLKLREGWEVRPGRYETTSVGCERLGVRVIYDGPGESVRLFGWHHARGERVPLATLGAVAHSWRKVAHAYFVKNNLESPWEESC
jgi:hypothetical protein